MSQLKVMEWDAGSKMKGRRVREQKGGGGGEEIVGTPVMIRLITKATTAVARVCCLYPGRCGGGGVHWARAGHVSK